MVIMVNLLAFGCLLGPRAIKCNITTAHILSTKKKKNYCTYIYTFHPHFSRDYWDVSLIGSTHLQITIALLAPDKERQFLPRCLGFETLSRHLFSIVWPLFSLVWALFMHLLASFPLEWHAFPCVWGLFLKSHPPWLGYGKNIYIYIYITIRDGGFQTNLQQFW